jgi:hypothetical protein
LTLIIAALTDHYVALVSDRRITRSVRKKIISQEDTDTKTFNICGRFLMGFTGLARIDGLRIEAWASKVLVSVSPENYFTVLTREIEAAFNRLGHAGHIPHAFLAAGFMRDQPTSALRPASITISNSFDANGRFAPGQPVARQFTMQIEALGNRRQVAIAAGCPMHDTTVRALEHRLRVVTKGSPLDPRQSFGPLVTALRDTARRSNDYVGKSALLASLPKAAVPAPYIAAGQVDYGAQPASLYLREDVRGTDDAEVYAPAVICPGLHVFGARVYSGPPRGTPNGYRY